MCDFFWQRSMDSNDHRGGDLSDIIRSVNPNNHSSTEFDFPIDSATSFEELPTEDFITGDSFFLRDPLLHELTGTSFYESRPDKSKGNDDGGGDDSSSNNNKEKIMIGDREMKRPCNLFSRVLQISPTKLPAISPRAIKPLPSVDMVKVDDGQIQVSPPLPLALKRRKSQARKVVTIPAPAQAASSSRPSGEVVPSDLWAWRKYGQKPIKGSPYPRGYYRCSSSKGCPARKQVERSRTNPNMLVITYTSEHNHPWPTQRNALAGSSRSQPSKNSKASLLKEETNAKENHIATSRSSSSSSSMPINVKEEVMLRDQKEKVAVEVEPALDNDYMFNQSDDFFAHLTELESDPMNLIFARSDVEIDEEAGNKGLDPFINMLDWEGNSFGDDQAKKELG